MERMKKGILHITLLTKLNVYHLFFTVMALLAFIGQVPADSNATDESATTNVITLNTTHTTLSPDFDGDGMVGFSDFLAFAGLFGSRQGDGRYEAKYDLDSDGAIGFSDFLIFVDAFGKEIPSPVITIPDANLRSVIEAALGKARGAPITVVEMKTLTYLYSSGGIAINDLTGLEFATNLIDLRLGRGGITDLSALSSLTRLTHLEIPHHTVSDLSSLLGLTNLIYLYLSYNNITDISALAGLTNLTTLYLSYNNITDISALAGLTNLTTLYLSYNNISDLAPLAANTGLDSGDKVDVRGNPLNATSISTHIPTLQAGRGVTVSFDDIIVFTDPQIYNDNLFVLPVAENIAAGNLPLKDYAARFYEHFNDEFDFLMFIPNLVVGQINPGVFTGAYYSSVKNDTQGIGKSVYFDNSWGSAEKLQGVMYFATYTYGADRYIFFHGLVLHELMHRWANFVVPTSFGSHWGFSNANGRLGGFDEAKLVKIMDGHYTAGWFYPHSIARSDNKPYSPIELYLAGFIPPEEVPDLWIAEDGKWLYDEVGRFVYANRYPIFTASQFKTYSIHDIISEHGARIPDASQAQKNFRAVVILLIDENHPATRETLEGLSDDISWFSHAGKNEDVQYNFYEATGGRGTITMDGLSQFQRRSGAKSLVPSSFGTPPTPIVDRWE